MDEGGDGEADGAVPVIGSSDDGFAEDADGDAGAFSERDGVGEIFIRGEADAFGSSGARFDGEGAIHPDEFALGDGGEGEGAADASDLLDGDDAFGGDFHGDGLAFQFPLGREGGADAAGIEHIDLDGEGELFAGRRGDDRWGAAG